MSKGFFMKVLEKVKSFLENSMWWIVIVFVFVFALNNLQLRREINHLNEQIELITEECDSLREKISYLI